MQYTLLVKLVLCQDERPPIRTKVNSLRVNKQDVAEHVQQEVRHHQRVAVPRRFRRREAAASEDQGIHSPPAAQGNTFLI